MQDIGQVEKLLKQVEDLKSQSEGDSRLGQSVDQLTADIEKLREATAKERRDGDSDDERLK